MAARPPDRRREGRTRQMGASIGSITSIFFDWDGTLMDSARMGLVAFTRMFSEMGLAFDLQIYEDLYSPNWYAMYEALGLPRDKWPQADDRWIFHYGSEKPVLVPGAGKVIEDLLRRGYELGVVSSGSESRVKREVAELGLNASFQVVICNEDTVHKKPHPEGLIEAMKRMRKKPAECTYVGDSPEDIEMGRQAGLLTIGVRSSYPGSKRLLSAKPAIYLESIVDLLRHF